MEISKKHQCSLCQESLGPSKYNASMWNHRFTRDVLCRDCSHPPCIAPKCKTCKTCRDPTCNQRTKCRKPIKPLHPKCFPQSKEEVATYLCTRCRWITCQCGEVMPIRTVRRHKRLKKLQGVPYICEGCTMKTQFRRDEKYTAQY